jgi:hypothetical protein
MIAHRWEYWDTAEREWKFSTRISYKAEGGREAGYRGYSLKENIFPGRWRVTVETAEGLKIGRTEFTVLSAEDAPELRVSSR